MKNTRNGKTYHCPFDAAIDVIGGKWKMGIIWHLGENVMRFNELQKVLPGVSAKTLTNQLRELEEDGVLLRTAYPEVPLRVEYRITAFGKTLIPVMQALCDWGAEYLGVNGGDPAPVPDKSGEKEEVTIGLKNDSTDRCRGGYRAGIPVNYPFVSAEKHAGR